MLIAPRTDSSTSEIKPWVVPPSKEFNGNDGSWSTFKINVGGQDLRVLASTKSGETYAITPEGCLAEKDPSNCPELRGAGILNSVQSRGYQANVSTSWSLIGMYEVNLEKDAGWDARGQYGYETVSLGPASGSKTLSMEKQVVVGVAELDYFMGHIPLGTAESSFCSDCEAVKPLLWQLRNASKIPSLSFAYTAGAKYRTKSPFGQLILGGYDSTRFKPNQNDFSFSFSNKPTRLLTVGVQSILATKTLLGSRSLSLTAHFSLLDSTLPHLWLPRDICDEFETAFGLTYDPKTDLYLVNATTHSKLSELNPEITLKLGNSLTDSSANFTNIVLPYSAFDLQASYPYYNTSTNYFPIRRAANESQYVLGRTLLQEAYLIVDYERSNFSLAQAAYADPSPDANILTIAPPDSATPANDGLAGGTIAGIVIGIVAILILSAIGTILFMRRRRRRSAEVRARELDPDDIKKLSMPEYKYAGAAFASSNHSLSELASPAVPVPELASPLAPQHVVSELGGNAARPPPVEMPASVCYYEMEGEMPKAKLRE